jgi:hypothetical protein
MVAPSGSKNKKLSTADADASLHPDIGMTCHRHLLKVSSVSLRLLAPNVTNISALH